MSTGEAFETMSSRSPLDGEFPGGGSSEGEYPAFPWDDVERVDRPTYPGIWTLDNSIATREIVVAEVQRQWAEQPSGIPKKSFEPDTSRFRHLIPWYRAGLEVVRLKNGVMFVREYDMGGERAKVDDEIISQSPHVLNWQYVKEKVSWPDLTAQKLTIHPDDLRRLAPGLIVDGWEFKLANEDHATKTVHYDDPSFGKVEATFSYVIDPGRLGESYRNGKWEPTKSFEATNVHRRHDHSTGWDERIEIKMKLDHSFGPERLEFDLLRYVQRFSDGKATMVMVFDFEVDYDGVIRYVNFTPHEVGKFIKLAPGEGRGGPIDRIDPAWHIDTFENLLFSSRYANRKPKWIDYDVQDALKAVFGGRIGNHIDPQKSLANLVANMNLEQLESPLKVLAFVK